MATFSADQNARLQRVLTMLNTAVELPFDAEVIDGLSRVSAQVDFLPALRFAQSCRDRPISTLLQFARYVGDAGVPPPDGGGGDCVPAAAPILGLSLSFGDSIVVQVNNGVNPSGVMGSIVYYGLTGGGPYESMKVFFGNTPGTISGLTPGDTYFFVAKVFTSSQTCLSPASSEKSATI